MSPLGVVALVLMIVVVRLSAGVLDRDRIRRHIQMRGGVLVEAVWAPLGRGWFGGRGDRIYRVWYRDQQGNGRRAYCKTSLWSGVYFTEDEIVGAGPTPSRAEFMDLQEKNRQLREELARSRNDES